MRQLLITFIIFVLAAVGSTGSEAQTVQPSARREATRLRLDQKDAENRLQEVGATLGSSGAVASGRSRRVYPEGHVTLGSGYSTLAGIPRHAGVERADEEVVPTSDNAIDYDFRLIESYQDLSEYLSIDASASFRSLSGGASARYSLYRSVNLRSTSVYMLVRMSVLTGVRQLRRYELTPPAGSLLADGDAKTFFTTYGDSFVYRANYGAELFALMEFQLGEEDSRESVSAAISGAIGAFKADASFSQGFSSIKKDLKVIVHYAQSGGSFGAELDPEKFPKDQDASKPVRSAGGVLTITPAELEYRIRMFPKEARLNASSSPVISVDVLDYYACQNRPSEAALFDTTFAEWTLDELATYLDALRQVRNTWAFALDQGLNTDVTSRDLYCLDDAIKAVKRSGEIILASPALAESESGRLGILPISIDLRAYLRDVLQHDIGARPQVTAGCPSTVRGVEDYIITKTVDLGSAPRPLAPRFDSGFAQIGEGHGTVGTKLQAGIRFNKPFTAAPRVLATARQLAGDHVTWTVSVASVSPTEFAVRLCKLVGGSTTCQPFGQGDVGIEWIAIGN